MVHRQADPQQLGPTAAADVVASALEGVGKSPRLQDLQSRLRVLDGGTGKLEGRLILAFETQSRQALEKGGSARAHLASSIERLSGVSDEELPTGVELVRLGMPLTSEALGFDHADLAECKPEYTRRMFIRLKTLRLLMALNDVSESEVGRVPAVDANTLVAYQKFRVAESEDIATREYRRLKGLFHNRKPDEETLNRYFAETGFDEANVKDMRWRQKFRIWGDRIEDLEKGGFGVVKPTQTPIEHQVWLPGMVGLKDIPSPKKP